MSRLDIIDAAFHYASGDTFFDQYVLFAFAVDGDAPTVDAITKFIGDRAASVPELGKCIREVPCNLDFPQWVRDDAPIQSRVREIQESTWQGVERSLAKIVTEPVDATRSAWRIHLARNVTGVPGTDNAVIVVFQVSHAVTDGRGASRLARLLFSPDAPPMPLHAVRLRQPRSLIPTALAAAVALPFRTLAARLAARRARLAYVRSQGSDLSKRDLQRPGIRGNEDPTLARVVHVTTCAPGLLANSNLSVTTLALTAVSVAIERYLDTIDEVTPKTLNCLVPMALPDNTPWPAANRVVNQAVELCVTTSDLTERSHKIRASLAASRNEAANPLRLAWLRAENSIPAPVFLAVKRMRERRSNPNHTTPESVHANSTVVSVNRGSAELELCGRPAALTAGFPSLGPGRSLTHGFYGLGDTVSVCVVACPDTFPDHERYAGILADAVADVADATS